MERPILKNEHYEIEIIDIGAPGEGIGKINDFKEVENSLTKETIICMEIECNNLFFNICINKKDLIGEPAIGRRFKGNIWMQGTVCL